MNSLGEQLKIIPVPIASFIFYTNLNIHTCSHKEKIQINYFYIKNFFHYILPHKNTHTSLKWTSRYILKQNIFIYLF